MALVPRARKKENPGWSDSDSRGGQAAPQPLGDGPASGGKDEAARRAEIALVQDAEALYGRYGAQIFNTLYQWIGDYEEAADLTQETFISAHRAREQFRGEAKASTWLYRIAHNHFKNRLKQRDRQREVEGPSLDAPLGGDESSFDEAGPAREVADWSGSPARLLEQKELQAQINRAVDSLAPEYRVVLILYELDGLAYGEIAEATGLTLAAVKTRLNRARAMVRQKVEPYLKI